MCIYIEYEFGYIYVCLSVFVCLYVCLCVWKRTESVFFMIYGILTVRLKIHRVFYRDAFVHHGVFPFRVPMHLSSICNVYFPRPDHRVQLQQPYSLPIKWFSLSLFLSPSLLCIDILLSMHFYVDLQLCFFPFCCVVFRVRVRFRLIFYSYFYINLIKLCEQLVANARLNPIETFFPMMLLIIVDAKYLPLF